jgi:hypothetical protein
MELLFWLLDALLGNGNNSVSENLPDQRATVDPVG